MGDMWVLKHLIEVQRSAWARTAVLALLLLLPASASAHHDPPGAPVPVNDNFWSAESIPRLGIAVEKSNRGATLEPWEGSNTSPPACGVIRFGHTVWFKFVAPAPGFVNIVASGQSHTNRYSNGALKPLDTVVVLHPTPTTVNPGNRLSCNDDGNPAVWGGSQLAEQRVEQGVEYRVGLGGVRKIAGSAERPGQGLQCAGFQDYCDFDAGNFGLTVSFSEDCDIDDDGVPGRCGGPDCADNNSTIRPGLPEAVNNEVDENCDAVLEYDRDNDGARVFVRGGVTISSVRSSDCNDFDAKVRPGTTDVPLNGVDDDCNGAKPRIPKVEGLARLRYSYKGGKSIKVKYLRVRDVTSGARVSVRCKARRCRSQARTALTGKVSARTVEFRALRGKRLPPGTVLEVRVTRKGFVGRYSSFRITSRDYKEVTRCLNPFSTKPRKKCTTHAL